MLALYISANNTLKLYIHLRRDFMFLSVQFSVRPCDNAVFRLRLDLDRKKKAWVIQEKDHLLEKPRLPEKHIFPEVC